MVMRRNRYRRQTRYTRYRPAQTWEDLGLIGDTLRFTDDKIVTQQALGYTKELCDVTCPMDIAVVYSMLHEGEGADITSKQLVNEHTRLASLYESGAVADGFAVVVKENDCDGYRRQTNGFSQGSAYAPIKYEMLVDIIKTFHQDEVGDEMWRLLHPFVAQYQGWSMSKREASETEKLLYVSNRYKVDKEAVRQFEVFKEAYPQFVKADGQWVENLHLHAYLNGTPYEGRLAKTGYCLHKHDGTCQTHNPKWERAWVFDESLKSLYKNTPCSSYSSYEAQIEAGDTTLIRFADHQRKLVQATNDKVVTRLISKSLTRMEKRGVVKQTSTGRGRTFQWIAWEWLQSVQNRILASNAKQRKLGDKVNGWLYTKGTTTMSYGMEINDHDWKPIETVTTYRVVMRTPKKAYYGHGLDSSSTELPVLFYHEGDAQAYANHLGTQDFTWKGGTQMVKSMNADYDVTVHSPTFSVTSKTHEMSVDGVAEIEEYLEPLELYKRLQEGGVKEYKALQASLRTTPSRLTLVVKKA